MSIRRIRQDYSHHPLHQACMPTMRKMVRNEYDCDVEKFYRMGGRLKPFIRNGKYGIEMHRPRG